MLVVWFLLILHIHLRLAGALIVTSGGEMEIKQTMHTFHRLQPRIETR